MVGPTVFEFEVEPSEPAVDRIDVYVEGELAGSALPPTWSFTWTAPTKGVVGVQIAGVAYAGGLKVAVEKIVTSDARFGDVVNVAAVQLYPVVRTWSSQYVSGLEREDFVVFDQGKEIEIEFFSDDPAVLTVALLLDISESMRADLGFVQEAACGFIEELEADDAVSAYAFNNALRELSNSSLDHLAVMNSIRKLTSSGGTALYDATARVLEQLSKVPNRKVLIVFSDGEDESSLATLDRTVQRARESDVLIYTIGIAESKAELVARNDLVNLGEATGGEAYIVSKFKDLPEVFGAILKDLRAQYILSYPPPQGKTGERSVEVRLRDKRGKVRCRESYFYSSGE